MNKVIFIIVFIILICSIFLVIKNKIIKKNNNPNELELTYEINAGIPFKWQYVIEDESIIEFVRSYVIRDDNKGGLVGASVYTNYVFRGLKEGTTTITFQYVNFTDDNRVHGERKHIVKVDDALHVSLVKDGE